VARSSAHEEEEEYLEDQIAIEQKLFDLVICQQHLKACSLLAVIRIDRRGYITGAGFFNVSLGPSWSNFLNLDWGMEE